jgi:hypothetical protein
MKKSFLDFRADFFLALSLILSGLAFFSCTTSGGETRRVEFKLEDSLSAYSKVKITLIDDKDTSRILAVVFNDSLANPKAFPAYDLPDSVGDFRVRVQGFDSQGLLSFQSTVDVKGGAADKAEKLPPEALPGLLAKLPGARLASLDVSAGTLVPPFDTSVFAYALEVPFIVDSLSVNAVAADSLSSLTWDGKPIATGVPSAAAKLEVGDAKLAVGVTPKGGALEKKYVITVTRKGGDVNSLAGITVSSGALAPAFDPAHFDYVDSVENDQAFAQVTAKPLDSNCVVIISGDTAAGGVSKPMPIDAGSSVDAVINVVSEDGFHEAQYSVTLIRKLSGDATLSSLALSDGALVIPDFKPGVLQYKAVTASAQVSIQPVASQTGAKIEVDGKQVFSGGASQPIDVNVGLTPIIIVVTSPNGVNTTSYVLTLERSSPNALLQALSLNGVPFDSAFQKTRLQYKAIVARNVDVAVVQFETADVGATVAVRVNGDSVAAGGMPPVGNAHLPLKIGLNLIKLEVTAPDKTSKTIYSISLLRQPASVAELADLGVTGLLKPAFAPATFQYTDTVPNFDALVDVKALAKDSNATVVVRLKRRNVILAKEAAPPVIGIPAPPRLTYVTLETDTVKDGKALELPMAVGDNLIEVQVVAEDGVTGKIYSVFVQRLASPNSFLSSLVIVPTGGTVPLTITPAFSPFIFKYVDTTFAAYVTVKPTAVEAAARIAVNGGGVASGGSSASITLVNGPNLITVDVISPDGTTSRKYLIQIEKRILIIKQPPAF